MARFRGFVYNANMRDSSKSGKVGSKVIFLEFNELCPELIARFIGQGHLPNFARMRNESFIYTTDAGERPPNLEPWIQWVTVHTGLTFQEHGIYNLGDGPKLDVKCVWDLLSDAGYRVGVCGSMNICYKLPINGYVLPDPWTSGSKPYPDSLMDYYKFVQGHVQEYTNDHVPLSAADNLRFLTFMVGHGMSFNTASSIVRQLASERVGGDRWKRAAILDKLQFDVFKFQYQKLAPNFSTFFLNSTAHLQHMYWRNMEPELFTLKPTAEEQATYAQAILFGYQQMDEMVGRFLDLAGSDATLIFSTALSQQPCLIYEEGGGKRAYRPRDFEKLIAFAGVTEKHTIAPVMAEQFYVHCENEADARAAEAKMAALRVNGEPAMWLTPQGPSVFAGCVIHSDVAEDAILTTEGPQKNAKFFDLFYSMEGMKSGMHHPDGMFWIRTPERDHAEFPGTVPLTSVAPTLLSLFDLTPPAYMKGATLDEFRKVLN